ncbi:MAG: hypothetical protein Q8Q09_00955 [Deltaproteobacteria bacterium]|nr:hypothetical protein [Deltaproteobacteria bacterium]
MRRQHTLFGLFAMSLVACAQASARPSPAPAVAATVPSGGAAAQATAQSPRAPAGVLSRSLVQSVVAGGLGAFLATIEVSPVLEHGRFVGFRLDNASNLAEWNAAGADLRVGDVIQRINGQRIERPEQALWAFEQLRIAPGLEIHGLRAGSVFRVYRPIVDG